LKFAQRFPTAAVLNNVKGIPPNPQLTQYTTLYAGDDDKTRSNNHKFIVQKSITTAVSRTIKDMFDG